MMLSSLSLSIYLSPLSISFLSLSFVCLSFCICMSMCRYVYVCVSWRPEALDSWELELKVVVSFLIWMLGTAPGPLEEQEMILTPEASLQPRV